MKPNVVCRTLVSVVLAALPSLAQEPAAGDLDSMSLTDLLHIEVVTPAATGQRAAESPAVVSVLTAEQLRDLGVTTLYEALNFLPGVQVMETYFGYSAVNVRGVLQDHYNNKVLLMVNGHPSREVVNGSFHLEMVPFPAVERIEFIRGPGSALYGTNAFAGVINVITRQGSDPETRLVSAGGGSFATVEAAAGFGQHSGDFDLALSASYRTDDGYPYRVAADERGQGGTVDYSNQVGNLFAHLAFKGLTLEAAAFSQDKEKLGLLPVLAYGGINQFEGGFLDLKWQRALSPTLDLTARLRHDTIDRQQLVRSFPFDGFQGHADADIMMDSSGSLSGAEIGLGYHPSERAAFLGGVVYEHRKTDPYVFRFLDDGSLHPYSPYLESETAHDLSAYGQVLVGLSSRTDAILGFRFNDDSDAGSAFLPRLGLVHRLGDATYLKLLYAEAYRSPDFFEKYVATYDVLFGDPTLDRERTRSLDLALDTTFAGRYNLQLDAFFLRTSDQITRTPTSHPDLTGPSAAEYVNAQGDEIWGLEASLIGEPAEHLRLFANYSHLEGESRASGDDLPHFANDTLNLGLSWQVAHPVGVKPNLQYVGGRGEVDAYTLLNLVVTVGLLPSCSVDLVARNLADEDIHVPEYIRGSIDALPGGPERSFLVRVRYRY